jgi:hypothetical protein
MGKLLQMPAPSAAFYICFERGAWVVKDANRAVVSQPYWRECDAAAARDRLIRTARTTTRPCLCCQKPFKSEGAHNRLCDPCRGRH